MQETASVEYTYVYRPQLHTLLYDERCVAIGLYNSAAAYWGCKHFYISANLHAVTDFGIRPVPFYSQIPSVPKGFESTEIVFLSTFAARKAKISNEHYLDCTSYSYAPYV